MDEVSLPEMNLWSTLVMESDNKMVYTSWKKSVLYYSNVKNKTYRYELYVRKPFHDHL